MCVGAIHWSGITRLVCGATRDDAQRIGFDEGPVFPASYTYLRNRGVEISRGLQRAEATAVIQDYFGFCRKVDSNTLLSTIRGIFHVLLFQYVVWCIKFATEPTCIPQIGLPTLLDHTQLTASATRVKRSQLVSSITR